MITIIRHKRIYGITVDGETDYDNVTPAGEVFFFNGDNMIEDACNFLWGRDVNSYLIFINGYPVKLNSDLAKLEKELRKYV